MIESHAQAKLHLEQLVHRQLAACVGQADDNPIDAHAPDDRRNVLDGADHSGIEDGLPHLGLIRVDEPDDLDAEFLAALEQLTRQRDRAGARADDQQALRRRQRRAHPIEREPPATNEHNDQRRANQEHASTDDRPGKPEVDGAKDERRRSQGLQHAGEQLPRVGHRAQVVEIGVIEADLA